MPDLAAIVRDSKAPRALVIGDAILDRYVEGEVERINPEAPVPVVHARRDRSGLGGAANVARNLQVLGCETRLLGVVGADEDGALLRSLCEQEGIRAGGLLADPGRPTTKKTRVISQGHHLLRVDWEEVSPIPEALEREIAGLAFTGPGSPQVVVLSDYAKGVLTPGLLREVIEEGARRGVPVLVDPKGRDFRRYAGAFLATPNRGEAEAFCGTRLRAEPEIREALRSLRDGLSLRAAVITLGAGGIAWLDERGEFGSVRPEAREVFDVTGAGDTVIAALACFLGAGAPLGEALRIANVAAGIKVGRVGTAAIRREEILGRLLGGPGGGSKVLERSAVRAWAAHRRAAGKRIVFTNGCFDLLHRGHVEYLRFCRSHGDVLIVGLNTDRSVRALKGEGRPVNREADRAEVLAALEAVDGVVLFDEDTPDAIVREVEPDVLVKGEDWREKGVVGREFVEARGGKVVLAPLVKGYSTTSLLDRAAEKARD